MTKFLTFGIRFCLERIAGKNFQHQWVRLNLLEGGLEQLCHCVPGEASDTCFYPKPRWFATDQATKFSHMSITVSGFSKNVSSHPAPVFVEFQYSVIHGKMFLQQETTDAKVSTSLADC